jgi:hypothetical protein
MTAVASLRSISLFSKRRWVTRYPCQLTDFFWLSPSPRGVAYEDALTRLFDSSKCAQIDHRREGFVFVDTLTVINRSNGPPSIYPRALV